MPRGIWTAVTGRNYAENSETPSQKEEEEEELLCRSAEPGHEDSSVFFQLKGGADQRRMMAEGKV